MDDAALWALARARRSQADMARYDELLERNAEAGISEMERAELTRLRQEQDRFLLRKAHAAALLRWRGHQIPSP